MQSNKCNWLERRMYLRGSNPPLLTFQMDGEWLGLKREGGGRRHGEGARATVGERKRTGGRKIGRLWARLECPQVTPNHLV